MDKDYYKEFKEESDADKWACKIYEKWYENYKNSIDLARKYKKNSVLYIWNSLDQYFGGLHKEINTYLREDEKETISLRLYSVISLLIQALFSAPKTDRALVVYRQVPLTIVSELESKGHYIEKGFLSTCLVKKNCASNCGNEDYMLKIYVPKGMNAIYANIVRKRNECELLFCPGLGLLKHNNSYKDIDTGKIIIEASILNW